MKKRVSSFLVVSMLSMTLANSLPQSRTMTLEETQYARGLGLTEEQCDGLKAACVGAVAGALLFPVAAWVAGALCAFSQLAALTDDCSD